MNNTPSNQTLKDPLWTKILAFSRGSGADLGELLKNMGQLHN